MKYTDFTFVNIINSGSYGTVYRAKNKIDSKLYAIKEIDIYNSMKLMSIYNKEKVIKKIKKEIEIMKILSKPSCYVSIPCYYGYFEYNNKIYIVMQYIDGLNLISWFKTKPSNLQIVNLMNELLKTLEYIHNKNVVHSDINPNNIMIDMKSSESYIIDFGISCLEKCIGFAGTPGFIAPEVTDQKIRLPSSDIWSLGSTLKYVYKGHNENILYIISLMMIDSYKKRLTASELLSLIEYLNIDNDQDDNNQNYETEDIEESTIIVED